MARSIQYTDCLHIHCLRLTLLVFVLLAYHRCTAVSDDTARSERGRALNTVSHVGIIYLLFFKGFGIAGDECRFKSLFRARPMQGYLLYRQK